MPSCRLWAALTLVAVAAACESNSGLGAPGPKDTGPSPENCSCDGLECGSNQCGQTCGTCSGSAACVEGRCVARCPNGVCEPQFDEDCNNCPQDCTKGCAVGPCPGECSAGSTDEKPCGNCGKAKRTCGNNCAWGAWGGVQGRGGVRTWRPGRLGALWELWDPRSVVRHRMPMDLGRLHG
jgi:hypothetical protein